MSNPASKLLPKIGSYLLEVINLLIYAVGAYHVFMYVTQNYPRAYSTVSTILLSCFGVWFVYNNVYRPFKEGLCEARQED